MENMLDKERELSLYIKCFKDKVTIPLFSVPKFLCFFYYLRTVPYSMILFAQNVFLNPFVFLQSLKPNAVKIRKKEGKLFPLTFPYFYFQLYKVVK
jgi:hypothetical protein